MRKEVLITITLLSVIILLFPSVNTITVIKYDDSYRGYGQMTYFNWSKGMLYGVDYDGDLYFLHFFKDGWKEEKILEAPEYFGTSFDEAYLSDSVVFVGSANGRIYYANPETGNLINIIDLCRLHIYFNITNSSNEFYGYYVLWGNKSGYLYILFNDTIYYLYRDIRIISKYHYNFTGFLVSAHRWNGGFVLKFGINPKPWTHKTYSYNVYYVKDGNILWNLTLLSTMYKWQSDAPDVYIYQNFVYTFKYNHITVYKDGNKIQNFDVDGDVVSLKRNGDLLYIFIYKGSQNILLTYNKNYKLVKRVILFDMREMNIDRYNIVNQKIDMYENSSEIAIFMYTCSMSNDGSPYIPVRIVYLDKNLNVVWRNWYGGFYRGVHMYPLWKRSGIAMVTSEFLNLYFVTIESKVVIDPLSWMDVKVFIIVIILLATGYVYSKNEEIRVKINNWKND